MFYNKMTREYTFPQYTLPFIDIYADNYKGSTSDASTIELLARDYLFLCDGTITPKILENEAIPAFRRAKEVLRTTLANDPDFVKGAVSNLEDKIKMLKRYARTGDFFSNRQKRSFVELAKKAGVLLSV